MTTTVRIRCREGRSGSFFDVDFYGELGPAISCEWKSIESKRDRYYDALIENKVKKLEGRSKELEKIFKACGGTYKFWINEGASGIFNELNILSNEIYVFNLTKCSIYEKYRLISKFLKSKGFVLDSRSVSGTASLRRYEIWKLGE